MHVLTKSTCVSLEVAPLDESGVYCTSPWLDDGIIIIIIKLYFQAHMQTITKAQRTHV